MTVQEQGDAEQDEALRPLHEAALGVVAEGLRLGPLVGDDGADAEDRERQKGQRGILPEAKYHATPPKMSPSDDPVGDRVEEGPFLEAVPAALATTPSRVSMRPPDGEQDDTDPE